MGELLFNGSVVQADPALVPVDAQARARGVQLIKEVAPHAEVTESSGNIRLGRNDLEEAAARSVPGPVRVPVASSAPFTTVVQTVERPPHPERFRHALAAVA